MKKILCLILSTSMISACGGGGGGGGDSSPSAPQEATPEVKKDTKLCSDSGSLTIQGIRIKISDYDMDSDSCLNSSEQKTALAAEQAKIDARTVNGDIVKNEAFELEIQSFKVIGTSDFSTDSSSGAKSAQLYTNVNDGKFSITFDAFPSAASDESIRILFSTKNATDILNDGDSLGEHILFSNTSIFDISLSCTYKANFNFSCTNGSSTVDIDNSTKFSSNPTNAFLVILACKEIPASGGGSPTLSCYDNHSSVPVVLN